MDAAGVEEYPASIELSLRICSSLGAQDAKSRAFSSFNIPDSANQVLNCLSMQSEKNEISSSVKLAS